MDTKKTRECVDTKDTKDTGSESFGIPRIPVSMGIDGSLYVYELGPVDYWQGLIPIEQLADEYLARDLYRFAMRAAFMVAKSTSWEGDFREGPFAFGLPTGDCDAALAVAWKQDNNGTTFVASPFPLPWLDPVSTARLAWPASNRA